MAVYTEALTAEQFSELDKVITLSANKFANHYGYSRDDFYQDGWEKALKIIEKYGYEICLLRRAIKCRFIDIDRANGKRDKSESNSLVDFTGEQPVSGDEFVTGRDVMEKLNYILMDEDFNSSITISEIDSLFEDGSPEQTYFRMVAVYVGCAKSVEDMEKVFDFDNRSMNTEIAIKMGYSGVTHGSFRKVRRNVRQKVARYLGNGRSRSAKF